MICILMFPKGNIYRGNCRRAIIFACVFHSYKSIGQPQTHEKLIKLFKLTRKSGLKGLKHVTLNSNSPYPPRRSYHRKTSHPRHHERFLSKPGTSRGSYSSPRKDKKSFEQFKSGEAQFDSLGPDLFLDPAAENRNHVERVRQKN